MKNNKIYFSPDFPKVYKCSSESENNQNYYYQNHLVEYISDQFSKVNGKIDNQYKLIHQTIDYQTSKYETVLSLVRALRKEVRELAVLQEKVKKHVKKGKEEQKELKKLSRKYLQNIDQRLLEMIEMQKHSISSLSQQIDHNMDRIMNQFQLQNDEMNSNMKKQYNRLYKQALEKLQYDINSVKNDLADTHANLLSHFKDSSNEQNEDLVYEMYKSFEQLIAKFTEELSENVSESATESSRKVVELMNEYENYLSHIDQRLHLLVNNQTENFNELLDSTADKEDLLSILETLNQLKDHVMAQRQDNDTKSVRIENKVQTVLQEINRLKEQEELQSLPFLKLGDRITISYQDDGTIQTGVYIQETATTLLWVNDHTHRLCLTSKKGLTIAKE